MKECDECGRMAESLSPMGSDLSGNDIMACKECFDELARMVES